MVCRAAGDLSGTQGHIWTSHCQDQVPSAGHAEHHTGLHFSQAVCLRCAAGTHIGTEDDFLLMQLAVLPPTAHRFPETRRTIAWKALESFTTCLSQREGGRGLKPSDGKLPGFRLPAALRAFPSLKKKKPGPCCNQWAFCAESTSSGDGRLLRTRRAPLHGKLATAHRPDVKAQRKPEWTSEHGFAALRPQHQKGGGAACPSCAGLRP